MGRYHPGIPRDGNTLADWMAIAVWDNAGFHNHKLPTLQDYLMGIAQQPETNQLRFVMNLSSFPSTITVHPLNVNGPTIVYNVETHETVSATMPSDKARVQSGFLWRSYFKAQYGWEP